MVRGLPAMVNSDNIRKHTLNKFGGYNHNYYAGDGEIYDMQNMSADQFPLLSPRLPRYKVRTLTKPNGIYAHTKLCWVDGTTFYYDGVSKGTVADSVKTFCSLNNYIIILPDKAYYNVVTDTFGNLEKSYTSAAGAITFADGTIYGEAAEGCCLTTAGSAFDFIVGDGVTISGCTTYASNNQTIVIQEISSDKKTLTFYENSFETGVEAGAVTVARTMPTLEYVCENENRLWGVGGNTIYSSKLGDPFNWNVFTGLSTDSYAVDVGSVGAWTGAVSYLGYPCFFKADQIYKMYGSKPSNYSAMKSASLGVQGGSSKSLAIAGNILFYLGNSGMIAYTGGIPDSSLSEYFGSNNLSLAVAGGDKRSGKYYVSVKQSDNTYALFVFDTASKLWHKEDASQAVGFAYLDNLYMLKSNGEMWIVGKPVAVPQGSTVETSVSSMVEFCDFIDKDPNKKGISKIQMRVELETGSSLKASIKFDSGDTWEEVKTLAAGDKMSYYLPIVPRRADHYRVKLEGTGMWRLHSLVRETYSGSEL